MNTDKENTNGQASPSPEGADGGSQGSRIMMESKNNPQSLVVFRLDEQHYALRLDAVESVICAVAVTPVPETPTFVLGLINMAGQLVPVFSLRRCLGLPDRAIHSADQFVIARVSRMALAMVVDEVQGVSVVNAAQTVAVGDAFADGKCRVQGLVKIDGDIIFIYDLEELFSTEDRERILQAKAAAEK